MSMTKEVTLEVGAILPEICENFDFYDFFEEYIHQFKNELFENKLFLDPEDFYHPDLYWANIPPSRILFLNREPDYEKQGNEEFLFQLTEEEKEKMISKFKEHFEPYQVILEKEFNLKKDSVKFDLFLFSRIW